MYCLILVPPLLIIILFDLMIKKFVVQCILNQNLHYILNYWFLQVTGCETFSSTFNATIKHCLIFILTRTLTNFTGTCTLKVTEISLHSTPHYDYAELHKGHSC